MHLSIAHVFPSTPASLITDPSAGHPAFFGLDIFLTQEEFSRLTPQTSMY